MIEKSIKISRRLEKDQNPFSMFVQTASKYESRIQVISGVNKTINAKSLMGVMTLSFAPGAELLFRVEGADEIAAMDGMCAYLCQ